MTGSIREVSDAEFDFGKKRIYRCSVSGQENKNQSRLSQSNRGGKRFAFLCALRASAGKWFFDVTK
jgi:hypothetical protein